MKMDAVNILELNHSNHQLIARNLFDTIWSTDKSTEITPNLLQAMIHSGSYLSGAFIDNKMVGAAFAFPATNNDCSFTRV